MAEPMDSAPTSVLAMRPSLHTDQINEAALLFVESVNGTAGWLHRCVERVEFAGSWAHRLVELDVETASESAQVAVPLVFIRKDEQLVRVSAQDDTGRSLPLLTLQESAAINDVALRTLAASTGYDLSPDDLDQLRRVAAAPPAEATVALAALLAQPRKWLDDSSILLTAHLAAARVALYALMSPSAGRRVVSVAWGQPVAATGTRAGRRALLGRPAHMAIGLYGPGARTGYNVEAQAPPATRIQHAHLADPEGVFATATGEGDRVSLPVAGGRAASLMRLDLEPSRSIIAAVAIAAVWAVVVLAGAAAWAPMSRDAPLLTLLALPVLMLASVGAATARTLSPLTAQLLLTPLGAAAVPALGAALYLVVDVGAPSDAVLAAAGATAALPAVGLIHGFGYRRRSRCAREDPDGRLDERRHWTSDYDGRRERDE